MHGQPKRRKCGGSSVFRRKTLAQGRFTHPEHVKLNGVPKNHRFLGKLACKRAETYRKESQCSSLCGLTVPPEFLRHGGCDK